MKKLVLILGFVVVASCAIAQMIVLEGVDGETLTTGDLLDDIDNTGITTNVVEIPGLEITARSGAADQDINVTVDSLGITIFNSGDDTDAFDEGEALILSFNKDIQIHRLDFNQFDVGESITVVIAGEEIEILYSELTHKGSDYLDTNLVVLADTEIEFYTVGSSTVGLDGIDITVLGSDPTLSLVFSNGSASVTADFDGGSPTNYVLQYCGDLVDSNGWNTISAPFASNATWQIEATNRCGFYRAMAE